DAATQMVHLDGRLRVHRRHVRQLRRRAGNRQHHSSGCLRPWLSTAPRRSHVRHHDAPAQSRRRAHERQIAAERNGAQRQERTVYRPIRHRRSVGAVWEFRSSDTFRLVSKGFTPVIAGSALGNAVAAPVSPKNVPNRGGEMNPSVDALRRQFSNAIRRAEVVWGETTVIVDGARVHDIIEWLHDDVSERYDYLSDVTAVEF